MLPERIRAERRAGEMLRQMAEQGARDDGNGGDRKSGFHDGTVKLADIGVQKKESHRWQLIAAVPEPAFERYVAETKEARRELSSSSGCTMKPDCRYADRIQARAIRRCGELLKQTKALPGARTDLEPREGAHPRLTREKEAESAGLSEHQRKTALRVASIPEPEFHDAVESDMPPTVTRP